MPIPLIAAAIAAGTVRAGVGAIQNRSNTRRQRAIIEDAYARGQQRMNIHQTDVRQSEGEGLTQRGLAQGGGVMLGGQVGPGTVPSVTGAHDLGGQQTADLAREQGLEQNDLLAQKNIALSDVNAAGIQGTINSIGSGVDTGMSVYGAGQAMQGMGSIGGTPGSAPTPSAQVSAGPTSSMIANSYAGVHPVDPLGHPESSFYSGSGTAKPGTRNSDFNVFSG